MATGQLARVMHGTALRPTRAPNQSAQPENGCRRVPPEARPTHCRGSCAAARMHLSQTAAPATAPARTAGSAQRRRQAEEAVSGTQREGKRSMQVLPSTPHSRSSACTPSNHLRARGQAAQLGPHAQGHHRHRAQPGQPALAAAGRSAAAARSCAQAPAAAGEVPQGHDEVAVSHVPAGQERERNPCQARRQGGTEPLLSQGAG